MPHELKLAVRLCDCGLVAHRYGSNLIFQAIDLESEFTTSYRIRSVVNPTNDQWLHLIILPAQFGSSP